MDYYKLEKPNLGEVDGSRVLNKFTSDKTGKYAEYIYKVSEPEYLYWDNIKFKPIPPDLRPEEFWYLVRQIRKLSSRSTSIMAETGQYFTWLRLVYTDEFLHKIDTHTGGQIFARYETLKEETRQKFISRGILEEAIASSQLEGANTTRKAAKQMLIENRPPRNRSEQMIVNNYKTMQQLEEKYKHQELTQELLFEMHAQITRDTIPHSEQYRLRVDGDEIVVRDEKYIYHTPPNNMFVNTELNRLIDYANDRGGSAFTHPIIKGIFLHFWIGYLHPFTDGNGRLARALFYWYLLRKNYWTFMYLPISSIIKKSPGQYGMAYVYTEQDDLDATYFYDYLMHKIMQSLVEFNAYIDKITVENREIDKKVGLYVSLNDRQKQLIHYLLSESDAGYITIVSHMSLNNISRRTATYDVKYLERQDLLAPLRQGKYLRYYASEKLKSYIQK